MTIAIAMPDDALEALAKLAYSSLNGIKTDELDDEWIALPRGIRNRYVDMVIQLAAERSLLDRIIH